MMSQTFEELKERASAWEATLTDYRVTGKEIEALVNGRIAVETDAGESPFGGPLSVRTESTPNHNGTLQLLDKLRLPPIKWWEDDTDSPPELRAQMLNFKFGEQFPNTEYFLRTRKAGGEDILRAVLSNQYTKYNHFTFVEGLEAALAQQGKLEHVHVENTHIDDNFSSYLWFNGTGADALNEYARNYAQWNGRDDLPQNGNVPGINPDRNAGGFRVGVWVRNSEDGRGGIHVKGGLHTTSCTNSLIIGWRTLRGIPHRWLTEKSMVGRINEEIAAALGLTLEAGKALLDATWETIVPTQLDSIVNDFSTRYGLKDETREAWKTSVTDRQIREGSVTWADLVQTASFRSQAETDREARETIEIMAGDLVRKDTKREKIPARWFVEPERVQYAELAR